MFALTPWTRRPNRLPRVADFDQDFETLLDQLFDFPAMETPDWPNRWGLTTEEKGKELLIRLELPGIEPEDVKVELTGDRLTIEAERKPPEENADEKADQTYTHVKRTMTLPTGVNLDAVEANYRNGILEVHVPRTPETLGRKIEVKT